MFEKAIQARWRRCAACFLAFGFLSTHNAQEPAASQPSSSQTQNQNQNQNKSLADLAREAAAKKPARQTTVITNDDLDKKIVKGPIPDILMNGRENSAEIIKAISEYRAAHTAKETEDVIRAWFERYDDMNLTALNDNIRANEETQERYESQQDRYGSGYDYSQEQKKLEMERRVQSRLDRDRRKQTSQNMEIINHIQSVFNRVRYDLQYKGFRYEWFKYHINPTQTM